MDVNEGLITAIKIGLVLLGFSFVIGWIFDRLSIATRRKLDELQKNKDL